MKSRLSMRWLAWPAIAGVVALLALWTSPMQVTQAAPVDEMTAVGPAAPVAIGASFTVDIDVNTDNAAFSGYQNIVWYDSTIVNASAVTQLKPAGMSLCGGTSTDNTVNPGIAQDLGCATPSPPVGAFTGTVTQVDMTCVAPGTSQLHLVTMVEDPSFGSALLDIGGSVIATTLFDGTVDCEVQADLWIIKTHDPLVPVAGEQVTAIITVINEGPNPAYAVVVTDTFGEGKVYAGENTAPYGCVDISFIVPNTLQCLLTDPGADPPDVLDPGEMVQFTILFDVLLSDAGKVNTNSVIVMSASAPGMLVTKDPNLKPPTGIWSSDDFAVCLIDRLTDPDPVNPAPETCDNVWMDEIPVEPAEVEITKDAPGMVLFGDVYDYTIDLHSAGPSPASDVVLTDPLPVGVDYVSSGGVCDTAGVTCGEAAGVVTCTVDDPMPVSETCVVTITVECTEAVTKTNTATVTWHDGPEGALGNSDSAQTVQLPPYNGLVKDARPDIDGIQDTVNLWLCKGGPDCFVQNYWMGPQIGKGMLDIAEYIFLREDDDSPNDADTDPEGLAAYEFQVKYDHKIFDIVVADAGNDGIDNDQDGFVDEADESVIEGWRGNINCSMTILTENWIMFGCVSAGQQLGNPAPVALWLATVSVTPDPDLYQRIRPTKDNGVVRTILDENCEVADIYASEPWPFTLPGGLTEDCSDVTVTVRMLEGDLNLDCQVNVLDEQIIAQRYGAVFGLLLYDPFYDLEPKLTDFDIDIKDLQFVFGRDGSECQNPIPDQDPEPMFPDP